MSLTGCIVGPVVRPIAGADGGGATSLQSFFQAGDLGFWIDPSDLSSMFQDSAGTTPVTAVEQPVGLIRDKSGRGVHGTQTSAANRPILCARLNQHIKTDDLSDAAWTKTACSIVVNGLGTLDKIVEDGTLGAHRVSGFSITGSAGMAFVQSFRLAPGERTRGTLTFSNTTPWSGGVAPIVDFSLTGAGVINSSSGGTAAIALLPDGSYRLTFAIVCAGAGNFVARLSLHNGTSASYQGDGVSGFYAGEDQLELGTAFTRYQSVDTGTVYDAAGFPLYLRFDSGGMWLNFTAGGAFTSGTVAHVVLVENTAPFTTYGPNTVNTATLGGFGVADDSVAPSVQGVSGSGSAFTVANAACVPIMPHVALATASGTNLRVRKDLGAAVSQAAVTNFNGTSWRLGRTLNDAGVLVGRCYGAVAINRIFSATQEDQFIRTLARKAPNIVL